MAPGGGCARGPGRAVSHGVTSPAPGAGGNSTVQRPQAAEAQAAAVTGLPAVLVRVSESAWQCHVAAAARALSQSPRSLSLPNTVTGMFHVTATDRDPVVICQSGTDRDQSGTDREPAARPGHVTGRVQ